MRIRARLLSGLLAVLLLPSLLYAATGTLFPSPWFTALDTNGNPIALAKACFYTAGTSTPATTYSDVLLTTPNANPLRANSSGIVGPVYLTPGQSYKFTLQDATGTAGNCDGATVRTQDNIAAVPTSSGVVDFTGIAGESLTAGQAVYLSAGDAGKTPGSWYKADAANPYSSTLNWVGIATASIASGNQGNIRAAGTVTGLIVAAGTKYYVGTAGALTSTAPTNARLLGEADTATSLAMTANPVMVPQSWLTGAPVSGGIPFFDSTTTAKSSALLGANAVVLGGGAGVTPFSEAGFTISQTGSHSISSTTQPRAGAFNSAGVTITNSLRTVITFNSDDAQMTNVGAMHSTSVNTSRMTVPTGGDGLYAVTCIVPWSGSAAGQRQIGVSKTGVVQNPLHIIAVMAGAGAFTMTYTMYLNAAAADYFECTGFQDSGGSLTAGTDGTTGRPQMYAVKLW